MAALGLALALAWSASPALAQKNLSETTVRKLMSYAWDLVPQKFTTPRGRVILTDKNDTKAGMVPMQVSRQIIGVARLSAYAQICGLFGLQTDNYNTMMRIELAKKKWSEQQMLFINQMHLFVVQWLTGNVRVNIDKDGKRTVQPLRGKGSKKAQTCSKSQRAKVRAAIEAYLDANPPPKRKAANKVK
ncbi:MAG: hypothetical protein AAFR04_01665 [Pseudomonadota bacterium]